MIVVNETRPTPKNQRASVVGAQLPQNIVTPSYIGSQLSQNNATISVIGAQLSQISNNKLTLVQHTESPIMRRPPQLNNSR